MHTRTHTCMHTPHACTHHFSVCETNLATGVEMFGRLTLHLHFDGAKQELLILTRRPILEYLNGRDMDRFCNVINKVVLIRCVYVWAGCYAVMYNSQVSLSLYLTKNNNCN